MRKVYYSALGILTVVLAIAQTPSDTLIYQGVLIKKNCIRILS